MRSTSKKLDLVATHPDFFRAPREPALVRLPAAQYLTLEGRGAPESKDFQACIGAMYGMAYTLKFAKKSIGRDYTVAPLEGLWWTEQRARGKDAAAVWTTPRKAWRWKLMIMVPDFITLCDVAEAKARLYAKRGDASGPIGDVKLEEVAEGLCVQAMHVGAYAAEPATVSKMRELIVAEHLEPSGKHHEIYLGDPRRTKPEKLKTILRQPVARA